MTGDSSDPTLRVIESEFAIMDGARKERERRERERSLVSLYEQALRGIAGPLDDPTGLDWRVQAYREAGGGYEGLQAIAEAALAAGQTSEESDA